MDDEDSIDLEALQAQIDMSMAFAEEMVSSWVKPSRKLSSRSNRDLEAELKEYMRRPPRLGVGAVIPESANTSRDAARLKGHLIGKGNKRSREVEQDSQKKDGTDSEGETRGGVIKKKARVDPFASDGKKKKKHKAVPENAPLIPKPPAPEEAEREDLEEAVNLVTASVAGPSTSFATPKHRTHNKNHSTVESSLDASQGPASPVSLRVLTNTSPSLPHNNQSERLITPSTERKVVEDLTTTTPATPVQLRRQAQSASLLKFPLLNLTPIHDDDSEHEDDTKFDAHDSNPKKKRRRKKKKKKKGGAPASEVPVALS
ncbi:hypothetical protein C0989_007037 [Termitomyces sp. Mn162]|nr:hypothetical protein C0989_007037 [Termitomyces sp. Mn162]